LDILGGVLVPLIRATKRKRIKKQMVNQVEIEHGTFDLL